jgi:hypothetical protein
VFLLLAPDYRLDEFLHAERAVEFEEIFYRHEPENYFLLKGSQRLPREFLDRYTM